MTEPSATRRTPTAAVGRALFVFVGVSYGILEAIDLFDERLGLPAWLFPAVGVAMLAGLPVVLATAWFTASGASERLAAAAAGERVPLHLRLFTWRNATLGGVGAFALIGLMQTALWVSGAAFGPSEATWAREEGIDQLLAIVEDGDDAATHSLVLRLLEAVPEDTTVLRIAALVAPVDTILSIPSGARISRRPWSDPDAPWEEVGVTPWGGRPPPGWFVLRLELEGYGSEVMARRNRTMLLNGPLVAEFHDAESPYFGTVRARGSAKLYIPGFDHLKPPSEIPDFRLDRFEVTNRQYKAFVDAGGYRDQSIWSEPFTEGGLPVPWAQAVERFVDRTNRPGPSTWVAGDYADGQDNHPVSGVSWFEAAAYARFAGKSLPTIWHWSSAATPGLSHFIVPPANLVNGVGTLPVGESGSVTVGGISDMAGNVREWVYNADPGTGKHFLLGGGWNDPGYSFNDAVAFSPWDRTETNGFRLATFEDPDHPGVVQARGPIPSPSRDFYAETPVSDEVFEVYRNMYVYDRMPLNAVIEQTDTTEDYIGELVTLDAAYDNERLMAYVYRPAHGDGPFQTVMYFPGSGVIYQRESSIAGLGGADDFIMKSGRAFVLPVYKGTLERGGDLNSDYPEETTRYRRYVVQWVQDMNRAIDYVEERADLDGEKLAYFGSSWGGTLGGLIPAVTPRLDAVVLRVAGLTFQRSLPEVEALNYLPRIKIPVIMINGEHDYFFPVGTSQKPMFDLLGTPEGQKIHQVYPGAHSVPSDVFIREALDFLDKYLGPVGN